MRSGDRLKMRKWPWRREKLFALLLLPTLTACQTTTRSLETELAGATFCEAARPIYYSRKDTLPTIAQIREHNGVGQALGCGWRGAK